MGRDPKSLKFKDVTSDKDFSVQLGCRFLLKRGIQGQLGDHPRGPALRAAWQAAAPLLTKAIRDGNVGAMKSALNAAIPDATLRVPPTFTEYWDIVFPAGEINLLVSPTVRALAQ